MYFLPIPAQEYCRVIGYISLNEFLLNMKLHSQEKQMRIFSQSLIILMLLFFIGCSSQTSTPVVTPSMQDNDMLNPFERVSAAASGVTQPYWSDVVYFDGEYWLAHKNDDGTIRRAFGKGVSVSGTCEQIIDSHPDLFKISSDNLARIEDYTHDGIRYVFFRQVVDDVEIKDSRVELRFARNGNLMLIGADVFPQININATPSVNSSEARVTAEMDSGSDSSEPVLVIERRDYRDFHLVWWVTSGEYKYHINAHDGSILEMESRKISSHSWSTESEIYELSPSTPVITMPYPYQKNDVNIPSSGYVIKYGDRDGNVFVDTEDEFIDVNSWLLGTYVGVAPCGGYNHGKIEWSSQNNESQTPTFDDSNSHMGERMVGYWANASYIYVKNIDPTFTGLDFQLFCQADCCCACNAFAYIEPPYKIAMFEAYSDCVATSEVADVTCHEYGHIYVATQYTLGRPPLSIHEAFADTLANAVTAQPEIGKDIRGAGTHFRSSDNKVLFDNNDCHGESHCMGNILAGALWEVRGFLGYAYTDYLWHQARFAQSYSFPEYVADFYMIDDDDDNVLNGTPNAAIFEECFWDNHHIPIPEMPDIPTDGVVIDIVPTEFPLEMDRSIGNNLWYTATITNLNDEPVTFDVWTAVETPWDTWYGPMIPASINIKQPVTLRLEADQEIVITVRQSIPFNLPEGVYRYHGRIGEFVDHENDILLDDGWIDFTLY